MWWPYVSGVSVPAGPRRRRWDKTRRGMQEAAVESSNTKANCGIANGKKEGAQRDDAALQEKAGNETNAKTNGNRRRRCRARRRTTRTNTTKTNTKGGTRNNVTTAKSGLGTGGEGGRAPGPNAERGSVPPPPWATPAQPRPSPAKTARGEI